MSEHRSEAEERSSKDVAVWAAIEPPKAAR
jgi:hypothetical protein